MPIEWQAVPVNFSEGTDTKTDPKAVKAGKFIRLENGVFTKPNQLRKRNGYTALPTAISDGTTLVAPQMVKEFGTQLVAQDSGKFLSLSSSQSAWIKAGNYISTELSRSIIDQVHQASGYADTAVLGNYALYGWSTAGAAAGGVIAADVFSKVYASIVDIQTGDTIYSTSNFSTTATPTPLLSTSTGAANITPVRCVTLGGTTLAIVYMNAAATALVMRIVTFSGSGVISFGSELTITTSFDLTAGANGCWDILATSTGATLVYISNPAATDGITISNINTAGSVTATANIAVPNRDIMHVSQTSNGNIWVYWSTYVTSTSGSISYAVYSSTLTPVLTPTAVHTAAAPYRISNMVTVNNSATQQTLYYGIYVGVSTLYTDRTVSRTATSAGVVGSQLGVSYGVMPYSRTFSSGSFNYAVFAYRGAQLVEPTQVYVSFQFQPTFFVLQLDPSQTIPLTVARFGSAVSASQSVLQSALGFMPSCPILTGSKYSFACAIEIQALSASDQYYGAYLGALSATYAYAVDFASQSAYVPVNVGGVQVLNGGMMSLYDGITCSEFGFHLIPEIITLTESNSSSGAIANGTYSYIAIFQWTDAQGNLHQSTPSLAKTITTTGANDTVTAAVSGAFLSRKTGVSIALFRTQASGTIYYQVSDPVILASADQPGIAAQNIIDVAVDASIIGNTLPYTYPGSAVLDNSVTPPSMAMVSHNNRLWFVDSEEKNTIWYTKSVQNLVGLSPSAFLINQIDKKYGDIGALGEMDEKLVALKTSGFAIQAGDGADDTGANSTLSSPQFVPSDVGCDNLKSVALTPDGLWFHSTNGIYILTRSLDVVYAGMEVEQYNSQVITSATLIPGKSQLRFLCSSGLTLVYDYIFKQWATFTNHIGLSATPWNSTYVYSTGTILLRESPTVFTDNGTQYSLLAQTSWLHLGIIQGFQRVRRFIMLGDFTNGASASHSISVRAAYDFSTTFQPAISYVFGAALGTGVFQYRERLPIQKCDTISLLIQETTTGDSAEFIDLTNMSFEAGVKRGVNKLGGAYSVG